MKAFFKKPWVAITLVVSLILSGIGVSSAFAAPAAPASPDGLDWTGRKMATLRVNPDPKTVSVEARGASGMKFDQIKFNLESSTVVVGDYQLGGDVDVFGKGISFSQIPITATMWVEDKDYPVSKVIFTHPKGDGNIVRLGLVANQSTGLCEIYNRNDPYVTISQDGEFTETIHLSSREAFTPLSLNAKTGIISVKMQILLDKSLKIDGGTYTFEVDAAKCNGQPPTVTPTPTMTPSPTPTVTATPTKGPSKVFLPLIGKACPLGTHWDSILSRCEYDPTPTPTVTAVPVCASRKLNVQYGTMSSSMAFAAWPGSSFSNPLMALGSPIKFSMSDGQVAGRSFLGWDTGYEVTGAGPTWSFLNGQHNIQPGHEYWFTVSYIEGSTLCITSIRLQWDPPEANQNLRTADQTIQMPQWQKNNLEILK